MSEGPRRLLDVAPGAGDLLAQAMHATRVTDVSPAELAELQGRVLADLRGIAASAPPSGLAWFARPAVWVTGCMLLVVAGYVALQGVREPTPALRATQQLVQTAPRLPAPRTALPVGAAPVVAAVQTSAPEPRSTARAPKRTRSGVVVPTTPESRTELELLRAAEASLAEDPASAFALTTRHLLAYPDGMLAQERELLAIQAQLKLGERASAELRAQRFRERYPRSPLERRLERVLAIEPVPGNGSDQATSTQQEVKP